MCRRKWSNVRMWFCTKSYKIYEDGVSWQLKFDLYWCEHTTAFLPNEPEHMLHCLFRVYASFLSVELGKLCLIQHKVRVVQTDSIASDRTSPGTKLFLQAIYYHAEWYPTTLICYKPCKDLRKICFKSKLVYIWLAGNRLTVFSSEGKKGRVTNSHYILHLSQVQKCSRIWFV